MTPTPERALEIAEFYETVAAGNNIKEFRDKNHELATILRHYSEILPKWQAVLDAELVDVRGVRDEWDNDGEVIQCLNVASANGVTEGTQLIIKPAP